MDPAAIDATENAYLLSMTPDRIRDMNSQIIDALELDDDDTIDVFKQKLEGYIYVDEISDLRHGRFVRWVTTDPDQERRLHAGGFISNITITDTGINVACKTFSYGKPRFYSFAFNDAAVFQKLSTQERILLQALERLDQDESAAAAASSASGVKKL